MARIEQYQEQVGTPLGRVDSGGTGMSVRAPELDFSGFAAYANRLAEAHEQSEINNARAQLASLEPQAQLDFRNEYNRIHKAWTPGQPPIAEQISSYIEDYANKAEQGLAPRAKELVRARSNELRTRYMLEGADAQVKIETDFRTGQYQQSYDTVAAFGAQAPTQFGLELAKLNDAVMADTQLSLTEKQALIQKNSQAAALSVAKVQAEADPTRTLSTINGLLGIAEPVLKPSGDVVEGIIRNESGGRMYADSGEVLKGPAITTKDGRTVHAYGKYQLLESTAKEQAAKLGIAWRPDVFLRGRTGDSAQDAETAAYHDQLGQAYIADQQREFNGDPMAIAAAHNMGPEATRGWIAGRPYQTQSGKWWYPKGPKDLAAMPEETRRYIEKLGKIEQAQPVAAMDSEEAIAFRLLSPEQQLSVRSAAQSRLAEINRQREAAFAVDRDLFKQRMEDLEATAKAGDPIEVPGMDEMVTFLGPAQAIIKQRQLLGYQQMAASLKQLPGLSNAELQSVAAMPNPEGSEDRENRQFVRDTLAAKAKSLLALRQNDPGLAAVQSSQGVQMAYAEWQKAASDFYNTPQTQQTREQYEAVNAAQAKYVTASFAQQKAWGVLEPKLPNEVVTGLAKGFQVGVQNGDPLAVTRFSQLPKQLGSYAAIRQVGDKAGDLGWFAMEGVPSNVISQLAQARAVKPEEANKLLPASIKPAQIREAVNQAFAPLTATFTVTGLDGSGDTGAATRYLNGGISLATSYLISGQASSPQEAAGMAYQTLYADRETVRDGVRIPNDFDADAVAQGLRNRLAAQMPENMYLSASMPGLSDIESRARIARNVRQNGRWITNETGDGAYLMVAGKPALDAGGQPIQAKFTDVQNEPVPEYLRARETARLDSLARGLK